jgi:hypothetical protein
VGSRVNTESRIVAIHATGLKSGIRLVIFGSVTSIDRKMGAIFRSSSEEPHLQDSPGSCTQW